MNGYDFIKCDICDGEACAAQGKYRVCSEFCDMVAKEYTIKDARISELEAIIAAAPHAVDCWTVCGINACTCEACLLKPPPICDCWKSKAGQPQ